MTFTSPEDPYRDRKKYHMAAMVSPRGVSALCFKRPRAIDLSAALWTNRPEAVTCKKCLALLPKYAVWFPETNKYVASADGSIEWTYDKAHASEIASGFGGEVIDAQELKEKLTVK